MALLRLVMELPDLSASAVTALTVDHGLRDNSAQEAQQVAAWCAALGVRHETLVWNGDKPISGIQARARDARYRLLAEKCAALEIASILTAHSQTDQAETVLMRLGRGAGTRGLSAMAANTQIAAGVNSPIRLLRPLLSFPRDRITATTQRFAQDFIDDPSNDDTGFERIRVRQELVKMTQAGIVSEQSLADTAAACARDRKICDDRVQSLFRETSGHFTAWGGVVLPVERVEALKSEFGFAEMMAALMVAVSGRPYRPRADQAEAAILAALRSRSATLSGILLRVKKDTVILMREPAGLLGRAGVPAREPIRVPPGKAILFDRRFGIKNLLETEGFVCAAGRLNSAHFSEFCTEFDGPREAASTVPVVLKTNDIEALKGQTLEIDRCHSDVWSLVEDRFMKSEVLRF